MRQLPTRRLQVNYCGLNKMEAKALALGLLVNQLRLLSRKPLLTLRP